MNKLETINYLYENLKPIQKKIFKQFINTQKRSSVFHCSRRLGKTHLLCVLSVIFALKKNNSQIRYASVTQKAVRKMVHPIFKDIFNEIPLKYRGKWNSQEGSYIFQNGSQIHCIGVNNGASDDARGTSADLALIDESGFVDELSYLVDSVLMPQLLTVEDSRLIMASSSPISPAHEFTNYISKSKIEKSYHSYTIHDAGYSKSLIKEFCNEAGGEESTTWRREYLNEIIIDSDYAVIPEANKLKTKILISEKKNFYHKYTAMDIGIRDLTVVLFGYYDFNRATLCIESEYVINGPKMTTPILAQNIKMNENRLYPGEEPYLRISDNNNLLLLNDLGTLHDCHFVPTGKDSLEAMVNELRIWIGNGRIEIDESCIILIESLKYGFWNDQRSGWGRAEHLGHFDAIAALMYLVRNINLTTNPIPLKLSFDQVIDYDENRSIHELSKLMG